MKLSISASQSFCIEVLPAIVTVPVRSVLASLVDDVSADFDDVSAVLEAEVVLLSAFVLDVDAESDEPEHPASVPAIIPTAAIVAIICFFIIFLFLALLCI